MTILLAVTVPVEIAHRGVNEIMHGHSLTLEVWTDRSVDLDAFVADVKEAVAHIDHGPLEDTIGARTFEDVAAAVARCTQAKRVVVRLPTKGYVIDLTI